MKLRVFYFKRKYIKIHVIFSKYYAARKKLLRHISTPRWESSKSYTLSDTLDSSQTSTTASHFLWWLEERLNLFLTVHRFLANKKLGSQEMENQRQFLKEQKVFAPCQGGALGADGAMGLLRQLQGSCTKFVFWGLSDFQPKLSLLLSPPPTYLYL